MNDMLKFATSLALGAALMLTPALYAQQGDSVTLNLKDADIREVIDLVSQVTGKNFIIDPRVRANVSVVSSRPLSADALYETFLSILQVHQFAAIESGGTIKIVPEATARHSGNADLPEPYSRPGDDVITQVIQVDNVQASQLVPILRPLVPQYGHLAAFSGSNMMIISDRAGNVDRMMSIIRRIDQASDEEIEVIRLEHASATETVRLLQALVQNQQRGEGAAQSSMIADERTNSVLISGDRALRLRLRALIAHLDTPLEAQGHTRVVYLRYGDAANIAGILNGYAEGRLQARGASEQRGAAGNQQVTILPDETTNALVITAPPDAMRNLRGIIEQLDIRRAQVLVEAIIVEVTSDRTADFGIQWAVDATDRHGSAGIVNFTRGGSSIVGIGTGQIGVAPDGLTFGVGRIRDGGTSFAALLRALASDADTNILSTPHLMAMDNEEAEFRVGQQVPFLTGQYRPTGQGQDQQGLINPFQTINREDVGLLLRITPKINEGNAVQMTIEQEVSSLAPAPAGAVDLVTNRREIRTRVIVNDGDIIVLGGLIDDTLEENQERVPLLGSIPILGHAFRYQRTSSVKRNLMVFLRPQILREGLETNYHTNQRYREMRELQEVMQGEEVPLIPDVTRPLLPPLEERGQPPER